MSPRRFTVLQRAMLLVGLVPAGAFVLWFPDSAAPLPTRAMLALPILGLTATIAAIVFAKLVRVECPRCREWMRRVTWDRAMQRDRMTGRPRSPGLVRFDCTRCGLTWRNR